MEKEGWLVIRSAGSHSLFDLIAIRLNPKHCNWRLCDLSKHDIKLIQCKSGRSKLRMVKDVLKTDIKKWEGIYSVSVEVI